MVGVIVVDDQAPFRRAAKAILQTMPGFALLAEADSGEQAVALARSLEPEVILMDVKMPGMGGIEATRLITTASTSTLVVLVSSYRERDLPADAHACGADGYVAKESFGRGALERIWKTRRTSASARTETEAPL